MSVRVLFQREGRDRMGIWCLDQMTCEVGDLGLCCVTWPISTRFLDGEKLLTFESGGISKRKAGN